MAGSRYGISEEDLWRIVDSLHDEIMIYDNNYRMIYVNCAAQRHYGKKPEELIGKRHEQLDDIYWANSTLPEVYRKKKTVAKRQITNLGLDIVTISVPIFDKNGEIKYVAMNVNDMYNYTDVNRAEEAFLEVIKKADTSVRYVHASRLMRELIDTVTKLRDVKSPVLILGETGTGKSHLAKYMHSIGSRSRKPFVAVNCACMNAGLIESELFGYRKGAFSGANPQGKKGIVEIADGGVLFLDEISEIPIDLQGKLLHFIQEKEYLPVGDVHSRKVDVQIIAATNKNLRQMAEARTFREDLYYRLNTFEVTIPPLRERPEDIEALLDHYLNHFNEVYRKDHIYSREAKSHLLCYRWPGNVRELAHVVEKIVVLAENREIILSDLPGDLFGISNSEESFRRVTPTAQRENLSSPADGLPGSVPKLPGSLSAGETSAEMPSEDSVEEQQEETPPAAPAGIEQKPLSLKETLEQVERELVTKTYKKCRSSIKTAQELGVSQPTAYRLIRKYCLDSDSEEI